VHSEHRRRPASRTLDVGSGQLRAYDSANLGDELWTSAQAPGARDALAKAVKFSVPTVADGHLIVLSETGDLVTEEIVEDNSNDEPAPERAFP